MKKKLEAELISIAHRILKLKNKSELIQLHQETQKLYEKLSVLKFVEENFSEVKPTIGHTEIEEKLETAFDNYGNNPIEELQAEVVEEKIEVVPEVIEEEAIIETTPENVEESIIEAISEEVEPLIEFERKTDLEPSVEAFKEEIVFEAPETKKAAKQISLEDLLSDVHSDPIFERVHKNEKAEEIVVPEEITEDVVEENTAKIDEEIVANEPIEEEVPEEIEVPFEAPSEIILEKTETPLEEKPASKKDGLNKITFGLNDRIAFEKQLFGGSSEDLNRVISQLSTYDTFQEAQDFIEDMVKPDYNNWEGKEEYVQRFMDIVERKFA